MAKKDFAAFMENGICRLQELCRELAGQPAAIREKKIMRLRQAVSKLYEAQNRPAY